LRRAGEAVPWLTLEEEDDNAERLCAYLLSALHRAQSAVDPELASLLGDRAPDAPTRVLAAVINAVAGARTRVTLVIDDCHHLKDPRARELLRFLVARSPDNLHVVLSTRPPAPLALGALRAHDEITEVDAGALRFDRDESDSLLNRIGRLDIGAEAVGRLCERTEGWPAALRLVTLSFRGRHDRRAAESALLGFSGGTRAVAEYLAENVLDRLEPRWAKFLLKTLVLDRLCADVCDEVAPEERVQEARRRHENRRHPRSARGGGAGREGLAGPAAQGARAVGERVGGNFSAGRPIPLA